MRGPLAPAAIGHPSIVPNAHQPLGQHVDEKAADKLFGGQRHFALLAAMGIVFPAKGDLPVLHADEPVVGDGYAVGVARQVVQHVFWSAERLLHVNHPLVAVKRTEELCKATRLSEPRERSMEGEFLAPEQPFQSIRELAPEYLAEHVFGEEESRAPGPYPLGAAGGESPGRHHAMDMWMMDERLPPGMEHAEKADLRP